MADSVDGLNEIIARNIREFRKKQGLSQLKLATECDKSQSFIGEIEAGRKVPSLKTLGIIAKHLNVKPYRLLFDESERLEYDKAFLLQQLKNKIEDSVVHQIERIFDEYS